MLTAPKLSSGITFVAGRVGLFTVNYAYIPTGVGRMISEYERYLNNAIDSLLTPTHRLGAAGEIRLGVLTICGGATYINSAQESLGPQIQTGLGASIRSGNTTYFSYGQIIRDKQYYMYSADYSNAVSYSNSLYVLSTGLRLNLRFFSRFSLICIYLNSNEFLLLIYCRIYNLLRTELCKSFGRFYLP